MTIDNAMVASKDRWYREQESREAEAEREARDQEAALRRSITADDVVDQLCYHHEALDKLFAAGDSKALGDFLFKVRAEYTERLVARLYA